MSQTPTEAPSLDELRELMRRDWRSLFPWRHTLGVHIHTVLREWPEAVFIEAYAAFGLAREVPPSVAGRLFRDFYLEAPPSPAQPAVAMDIAIGWLRRADPAPLRALLQVRNAAMDRDELLQAWYDVSTLCGRVATVPALSDGTHAWHAGLEPNPILVAGGAPIHCINAAEVGAALLAQLEGPLDLASHGVAVKQSWQALAAGRLPDAAVDPTAALLGHHTDQAVATAQGRLRLAPGEAPTAAAALAAACQIMDEADKRQQHLLAGLRSPSRPRRRLSFQLLRTAGLMDPAGQSHYDDQMPWPLTP
ncbi:hypothetical protein ACS5PK_01835 [Roseateles sp. DB2]|uniref:hypothetical protein n=1 Tax=Roseateles sp. DB2 TaxID=3453717 RepID=UPI003EEB5407